jgi:uncharacterized membrane protein YphA (DoxX/SURF4 family)
MAYRPYQKPASGGTQVIALVLLRVFVGVFMFFFGFEKAPWILDATPLAAQLSSWLVDAPPVSRWYLERLIPGAPAFARVLPLAAMGSGIALTIGFWTRIAATVSLLAVLSLQLAAGAMFKFDYLTDAGALPLAGGLLALMIGGERKKEKRRTNTE